jgi:hypothetical protein
MSEGIEQNENGTSLTVASNGAAAEVDSTLSSGTTAEVFPDWDLEPPAPVLRRVITE